MSVSFQNKEIDKADTWLFSALMTVMILLLIKSIVVESSKTDSITKP